MFYFWLDIVVLVDYFQAVRVFLAFSFFIECSPNISLCNIVSFTNCTICFFFFLNTVSYSIGMKIKIPRGADINKSANTVTSICTRQLEKLSYGIIFASPPVNCKSFFIIMGWFLKLKLRSRYFVGCCFRDFLKTAHSILVYFSPSFFSMRYIIVHVVHLHSSMDNGTAWKKSRFILSALIDFSIIDKLSIAVHAFVKWMLISLSVDEIFLPIYMNWSTNYRGWPLKVETSPSCL